MTGQTSKARGPYAKTAAVRERIIDAAIDVFAISGFRASTMKDIADRAGISQRGLAHHFASKFDLLSAVLSVREQESASLLAPSPSGRPVDALESMLEVIADKNKRPGLVELYSILAAEGTTEDHPAHADNRYRYDSLRQYFAVAFDALQARGEIRSIQKPNELAASFLALIEGLQLQWLYDRDAINMEALLRAYLYSLIPGYEVLKTAEATRAQAER